MGGLYGAALDRDGMVRAYVVTVAPGVAGRIVNLPVGDNQMVHKGDVLFEIEPDDYQIALEAARAQVARDQAALDYARANEGRQATLRGQGFHRTCFSNRQALCINWKPRLPRTRPRSPRRSSISSVTVRSPVNGYVTNLLAQRGDYANIGQNLVSLVDADSFWVDRYFEETSLGRIRDNDPATVRLMGYSQLIRGHVGGVARGITVANAQPGQGGLASVNPIFTWVRLAQRVPVRIHIDHVPDGVRLVAGTTASVEVGR